MADPLPSDDGEFRLVHMVALARHAHMSTSYKPALLKALVRIAREREAVEIDLRTVGAAFVRLYWIQTVVFHLRQAATLVREPEVVQAIRRSAERHHVRRLSDLPISERERLVADMARILRINVLRAFHRSKPEAMPSLFSWTGGDTLLLSADSLSFLQREGPAIEAVANLWWARYLERVNVLAPHVIEKVEREGAERKSLARYLDILRTVDDLECFYCGTALTGSRNVHVDHVIPWSFLLTDPPWDLVLSCSPCNLAKSDVLPHRDYLQKLARLHGHRARRSMPAGFSPSFLPPDELVRFYDAALSVEWPSGWTPASLP